MEGEVELQGVGVRKIKDKGRDELADRRVNTQLINLGRSPYNFDRIEPKYKRI